MSLSIEVLDNYLRCLYVSVAYISVCRYNVPTTYIFQRIKLFLLEISIAKY